MRLDIDAMAEALDLPTIIVGGEEHVGKLLSLHQVLPMLREFEAMDEGDTETTPQEAADLLARVFETAGFPSEVVEQIPMAMMEQVLTDFFSHQVEQAGMNLNRETRRASTK